MALERSSPDLDYAVKTYKTIRPTVNLAKKMNVRIIKHYAKFTRRGNVSQHNFVVVIGDDFKVMSNEILYSFLKQLAKWAKQPTAQP